MTDIANLTPAAADQRLAELKADPAWRDKFLSGGPREAEEFHALTAKAAEDRPDVDAAMAGQLEPAPFQTTERLQMVGMTDMLRGAGIEDGPIRNLLTGKSVTAEERHAAESQKSALLRSSDWTAKYMAGDGEHRKQMLELNMIISSPVAAPQ